MRFIKEESKHPLQVTSVAYNASRPVHIGDVFYKIKAVDFQVFREPCLVCGDKKELTINGVTFKCPCCGSTKEVLRINGYVVQKYRVFSITDEVRNDEWKADDHHRIKFGLYRKAGHGYQLADYSTCVVLASTLEKYFNLSEANNFNRHTVDDYIFDDYQLAVRTADKLTAAEVQKLEEYNAVHGSNHKPVFTKGHDRKSN